MAILGDVIIKLAADFAEFAKGMSEGKKTLEEFGEATRAHQAKIEAFIDQIKAVAKATGLLFVVKEVVDYADAQVKAAEATTRLAEKTKLSVDQIKALEDASKRTGQSIEEQAKFYETHKDQLDKVVKAHQDLAGTLEGEEVKAWKDVGRASDEAYQLVKWALLGGSGDSWAVATVKALARGIDNVGDAVAGLVASGNWATLQKILSGGGLGPLFGLGQAIGGAYTPEALRQDIERKIVQERKDLAKLEEDANNERDADMKARAQSEADILRKSLADREKQLIEAQNVERTLLERRNKIRQDTETLGKPVPTPDAAKGGGGGGGGRTDDDLIDAQIRRYDALAKSAQGAFSQIEASAKLPLDELQRNVTVNQQIEDILGKLTAKYVEAHKEEIARLRVSVTAAETARAAVQLRLQDEQRAAQLEEQLGDGTAAYTRRINELKRAIDTNRVSEEAANRERNKTKQETEQAARAASQYGDALGGLAGGFAYAMNAETEAQQQFKIGEAAYTGLTSAIGEGIDVLVGKSNKGFAQIAADFLLMIAKMEAAAAASAAIKLLVSAVGGALGAGVSAVGSSVAGSLTYGSAANAPGSLTFGGPRQGGGPVWPGMAYTVGEHGRERFVPNVAGHIQPASGDVTINNYAGVDVQARRQPSGDLDVTIQAVRRSLSRDVARGGNEFANSLERAYGVSRGG